jgi:hypothetical protein
MDAFGFLRCEYLEKNVGNLNVLNVNVCKF